MKVASNFALAAIACVSESSAGFSTRSILLSTSTFGCRTSASLPRIASASSSMPFLASMSSATMSASCAPLHAVVTIARSSRRRGAKMPGVSISTSCAVPIIAIPRTSERVVCTFRLTIVTFDPTSALVSVDLPAFGAPINATKPQRCAPPCDDGCTSPSTGSAIRRIHFHAFAREHGGGGGLVGGALGAALPLRGLQCGNIDRNAEFRIMMWAGALDLAISWCREPPSLRPFLQHGLRIAQRTRRRHHTVVPPPLDQGRGGRIAAIDEHRTDQSLAHIGEDRGAAAPPRIRFRVAQPQRGAEIDLARHIGAAFAPHEVGQTARQLALVPLRERAIEHVRDRKTKDMIAEKLEPLVTAAASLLGRGRGNMRERAIKDRLVGKRIANPALEFLARLGALRLPAHRTIENSLSQRTTHGQRHTFQAASPSPTEKKMISARPTMLSIGT